MAPHILPGAFVPSDIQSRRGYFSQSSVGSSDPFAAAAAAAVAARNEVQAALSNFRFSSTDVSASASTSVASSGRYYEMDDDASTCSSSEACSRRPSVQRTSSAPEPSASAPVLFVEPTGPSSERPSLARACSESLASGVLERRRHKCPSDGQVLPMNLMLDLADLPKTMGAGNVGLLRAARRALIEPQGFDWGRPIPASAPASAANSTFLEPRTRPTETSSHGVPADQTKHVSPTESIRGTSRTSSATTTPSKTCFILRHWNRPASSYESEWDWALAGNARATHEAMRFSQFKETKEPVHDIWQQLPDWVSRRSSVGGRDADLSLRGPSLHQSLASFKMSSISGGAASTAEPGCPPGRVSLSGSTGSPRGSISGRSRGHQAKASVHVPIRAPLEPAERPMFRQPFVGAKDHALDKHRSHSVERKSSVTALHG